MIMKMCIFQKCLLDREDFVMCNFKFLWDNKYIPFMIFKCKHFLYTPNPGPPKNYI